MKQRSTRRALLLSVLSLLLCVSMLVGTTFAWFTDSVTSANNIIQSGNLDIELEYWTGSAWKSVSNASDVLSEDLYEPGYVQVAYLRLKNAGTLALKYQIGMNIVSEVAGKNQANETFKLSDHIQFGIVEGVNGESAPYADRAAAMAAVTAPKKISAGYTKASSMLAGEELYLAVVAFMPTTVGNEANHNGVDVPKIDLGLNVFATQYTQEEDSYDKYYDENAAVFTVAEANAMMLQGKDIALVNCNEPQGVLEVPAAFTGTLTLVNSTVKAVVAAQDANIVILGNVVVNAKGTGIALAAAGTEENGSAITANGNLAISGNGNLTAIAADTNGAFGIGGLNTAAVTIKDITIDYVSGGYAYGVGTDTKYYKDAPEGGAAIGSGSNGAKITLENVTVNEAIGGSKAAAIGARYHVGVDVVIKDSIIAYAEGGVSAAGIGGSRVSNGAGEAGTNITITNSQVTAVGGAYGAGIGSGYDTHCQSVQPLCTINIADSTIKATGGKYAAGVGTGFHTAALAGEIKNSTVTAASGEKVYKDTYTAAMDVGFGVVDPAREGQQTASKLIYNGTEITLADAPDVVVDNAGLQSGLANGATLYLPAGTYTLPSLANYNGVTIIGSADTAVAAVNSYNFGADNTFKGLTITNNSGSAVRYGYINGDVTFEDCQFIASQWAFHVDDAKGNHITFNNCTFKNRVALAASGTYEFNGCTFLYHASNYNTINIYSEVTFNDCYWDSWRELAIADGGKAIIDGDVYTQRVVFISDAQGMEKFQRNVNSKGETYAGKVVMLSADIDMNEAYYATWTPVGQTGSTQFMGTFDGHGYTIKNLNINTASKTGANYAVGLFGWLNNATVKNLTIENATVVGNHNVGVIAGYMETAGCTISNCHVINATIVAKHANEDACGDKVGAIVGHAGNDGVKVENCSAKDCTITAGRDAGQIVGAAKPANVVGCTAENVSVTPSGECTGANIREEVIGREM